MPNPKRKHSHARTSKRRTHWTTDLPEVTPAKRHCASPDGYYKGRRLPGYKDKE
jgi:ribosomal protein L32